MITKILLITALIILPILGIVVGVCRLIYRDLAAKKGVVLSRWFGKDEFDEFFGTFFFICFIYLVPVIIFIRNRVNIHFDELKAQQEIDEDLKNEFTETEKQLNNE